MEELLTFRDIIQAQLDGKCVQYKSCGTWVDAESTVIVNVNSLDDEVDIELYRIKPKVKRFCNGVELDDCITNAKDVGDKVYLPMPFSRDFYTVYTSSSVYQELFDKGLIYNNSKAAAKHGKAMAIVKTKE